MSVFDRIDRDFMTPKQKAVRAAVGVLLIPVCFVVRGWALSIIWGWTAVPYGLPEIDVVTGGMVWLVASFIAASASPVQAQDENDLIHRAVSLTWSPVLLVGIAWVMLWIGGLF